MQTCKHNTCKFFRNQNCNKGVASLILNNYNGKGFVALLGKELHGSYAGKYNLCSGRLDPNDKDCWIKAAKRELREEFKINLDYKNFDKIFKDSNGIIRYIIHNRTPIFIGVVSGLSRKPLNTQINMDLSNSYLNHCYKEISEVDWFDLNGNQLENKKGLDLTAFSIGVLRKIDLNKL